MDGGGAEARGACREHEGRAAFVTCARCGDHLCDECGAGIRAGVCPPCSVRLDDARAPTGRRILLALAFGWALYLARWAAREGLGWPFELRAALPIAAAFAVALLLGLNIARGSDGSRSAAVTLHALTALLGAMAGDFVLAASSVAAAGLLLHPSVSAFQAVRARRRP